LYKHKKKKGARTFYNNDINVYEVSGLCLSISRKSIGGEKKKEKERERARRVDRYGITCALKRRSSSAKSANNRRSFRRDFIRSMIFGDNDRRRCSPAAAPNENRCVLYSTYEAERRRASSARLGSARRV